MFGKFFASTFTGSMVGSGLNVFAVWGYVIANTRQDGTVEINPPIVAAVLGCNVGEVTAALDVLTSPDPDSRSKKEEGRRLIQQAAFLYSVPTYADYRAIRDDDGRKEYMRQYMQGYRDKKKAVNVNVNSSKQRLAKAEAEADTSKKEKTKADAPSAKRGCRLPADWVPSEADIAFAEERRINWRREAESFRDYWTAKAGADACKLDWGATWRNWVRRSAPSPRGPDKPAPSKTMQAIQRLERMKNGNSNGLALEGSDDRVSEADVFALGRPAS